MKKVIFKDWLVLYSLTDDKTRKEVMEAIGFLPRCDEVCGCKVPEDFNLITYGQLDDLHDNPDGVSAITNSCKVILGVDDETVLNERAEKVLWFVHFCNEEVKRINNIFKSIRPNFTSDEKLAGIEKLSFGSFGVLDWYARRMQITDQDEVRNVPWVRIYKCMKMDNEKRLFERRYGEIIRSRAKNRRKGG